MTDPRNDPAASPVTEGDMSPPEQTGQRAPRHGLFHRGTSSKESAGSGASGASAVGTATRSTTSSSGTAVPQQAGQTTYQRAGEEERYGRAEDQYGYGAPAADARPETAIARVTSMSFSALLFGALCLIAVGVIMLVWPKATLIVVAVLIGIAIVASGVVRLWDGLTAPHNETGGTRAAYVVIGLLAIVVGIYLLRHHALSLFLLAFVTGVYFIVHGIADIVSAASGRGIPGRAVRGTLGVFSIAAGIILVVWPGISLILLLLVMAAWLLFYGVMLAFLAFNIRSSGKKLSKAASGETARTTAAPARAA